MENLRGAALMVFAMFFFAIVDSTLKLLSLRMPASQGLGIICLGGLIGFLAWSRLRGRAIWTPAYLQPRVIIRSFCEILGSCFMTFALALIPLCTASAGIQTTPLVVAMGAGLFLGQPIGWRRWIAIAVGFAGVLIIIRPGFAGFAPATLFAVGGMLALAARDLITRSLKTQITSLQLGIHAFAMLTPVAFALPLIMGQSLVLPQGDALPIIAIGIGAAMAAYLGIVAATRTGNAGVISSFRYSRMVFALAIGYLVFAEIPDLPTLIGAAIIITSGVYTLLREARLHRASLAAQGAV